MAGVHETAPVGAPKPLPVSQYTSFNEKDALPIPSQFSLLPVSDRDMEASAHASPPISPPPERLQKWNESKTTMFRFFFTLYSFIIMGMNDGAFGVNTPFSFCFLLQSLP